jgi:hypothetical protein
MLKSVKATLAVIAVSLTFVGSAQADINEDLKNICNIVKSDDKGELRKKIRSSEMFMPVLVVVAKALFALL